MEFERKRFFPEMDEEEERRYGFLAIEGVEGTYLPELEKRKPRHWKKISQHRKKALELRHKFFPITPNDFLPIEGMAFELGLTERLLRNEKYVVGKRLRVDLRPGETLRYFRSIIRLRKPEGVYQDQNFLDQAVEIVNKSISVFLAEYAWQIGVDYKEGREFKAWSGSLRNLANNFSAAIFEDAGNSTLYAIVSKRKGDIIQKRKAMLQLSTFI